MSSTAAQHHAALFELLSLPFWGSVSAGFPSPTADFALERIDLVKELVTHPQATFFMRYRGIALPEFSIADDDVLVVNRALTPRHQNIVLVTMGGEYYCKQYLKQISRIRFKSGNLTLPDLCPAGEQEVVIFGVVTSSITRFRV